MQATLPQVGIPIDAQNVSRQFAGGVLALDRVSLSVTAGEFVAILGPSGCGKSTFLRLVAGLDRPTAGSISMPPVNRGKLAYVFQDAHLMPWRSCYATSRCHWNWLDRINQAIAKKS